MDTPLNPPQNRTDDSTKKRLIAASIRLFGQHGFEGVSTRALCDAANANVSAIKYHFGDKEGLYRATLELMIAEVRAGLDPALHALEAGIEAAEGDPSMLKRITEQFIAKLTQTLLADPQMEARFTLFVREHATPSHFFPLFYEGLPKRLHKSIAKLIGAITGEDPESERVIIRTHIIAGQMMVFLFGRLVLLRRLNVTALSPDMQTMISDEIIQNILRSLFTQPLSATGGHGI